MAINNVNGGQNVFDKLVSQIENAIDEVKDFVEDFAAQNQTGAASADETSAGGFVHQFGMQRRSQIEAMPIVDKQLVNRTGHHATKTQGVNNPSEFPFIYGKSSEKGAYYHKIRTDSTAETLTLKTENAVAPQVKIDNSRYLFFDQSNAAANKNLKKGEKKQPELTDFTKNKNGVTLDEMNHPLTGPKDRPSIYMGGNSSEYVNGKKQHVEVDAGLAWNRVVKQINGKEQSTWTTAANGSSRTEQFVINPEKDNNGKTIGYTVAKVEGEKSTVVSRGKDFKPNADGSVTIGDKTLRPNFAFRPFFRSTDKGKNGAVGYHSRSETGMVPGGKNDVQVYAGEKFDMKMTSVKGSNRIQVEISNDYGKYSYSPEVVGFRGADGKASLKRVDSIDQKGLEKGSTKATKSRVWDGSWGATSVTVGGRTVPFTGSAGVRVKSPEFQGNTVYKNDDHLFSPNGEGRTPSINGSEQIYINPPDVERLKR